MNDIITFSTMSLWICRRITMISNGNDSELCRAVFIVYHVKYGFIFVIYALRMCLSEVGCVFACPHVDQRPFICLPHTVHSHNGSWMLEHLFNTLRRSHTCVWIACSANIRFIVISRDFRYFVWLTILLLINITLPLRQRRSFSAE